MLRKYNLIKVTVFYIFWNPFVSGLKILTRSVGCHSLPVAEGFIKFIQGIYPDL